MKFTAFIDESVRKNKSISSSYGGFKILRTYVIINVINMFLRNQRTPWSYFIGKFRYLDKFFSSFI